MKLHTLTTKQKREGKMIGKFFLSVIVTAAMLIPTWMYLFARSLTNPQGFWENVALLGLGVYFLGFFQVLLLFGGVWLLVAIWTSPRLR